MRAVSRLFAAAVLLVTSAAEAQYPVPRVQEAGEPAAVVERQQPAEAFETASRLFEAGRWQEALEAFESAPREDAGPPAAVLKQWGIAAFEAGRPFAAYVRLSQFLAGRPSPADQDGVLERVRRAKEALLVEASRFSRLLASAERQPDEGSPGERHVVRVAARDGEVSLEGMSGLRVDAPLWRRAEEIPTGPYLDLLRRLLDAPAVTDDVPAQAFDPNAPGPRRGVVLRLVIGDEDRRLEALRGEPYERLRDAVDSVLEFARAVRAVPDAPPRVPAVPLRPAKKRK